jgi:DNA polymerase I-like protein with 3'-5' exonuclease and polymerase domains
MNKVFLFGDYSQAEIRVAAWAGPVPKLKEWFKNDEDIHLNVAQTIGRVVEEHKVPMPRNLWQRKPWQELNADDPEDHDNERDLAKRTVHANTNGMGEIQFSIITGVPVRYARLLQEIYHREFPEIRGNYHSWIRECLYSTRILENPLGWRRKFYDIDGPPLEREAYAWYPQSTIGLLTLRTYVKACTFFAQNLPEAKLWTPRNIRSMGFDIQLEVHDALAVCLPDDPVLIRDSARAIKKLAEHPMTIKGDVLVVPMDFKVGKSWGELKKLRV